MTDGAWDHHLAEATRLQYVRHGSLRPIGMVNYFQMLTNPLQVWTDTRPDYLIDLSERLMNPSLDRTRRAFTERSITELWSPDLPPATRNYRPGPTHPVWWDPDLDTPRRRHCFWMDQFPFRYYANLALTHMIGDPYSRTFRTDPTALVSNALEAIGRQALTPSLLLANPRPPRGKPRKNRNVEISW